MIGGPVGSVERSRAGGRRLARTFGVAATVVLVVTAVACRPLPLGGASNRLGNDVANVANCPQFQPTNAAPCGPQPMLWTAIQAPYEMFANGDPYATKCARNAPVVSAEACSSGPYAGGATNELYDPTGYEYAIEVGPADVGRSLDLQVWDAGSYQRTIGTGSTTTTSSSVVTMTAGSQTLSRTAGTAFQASNVGKVITGTGIPAGTTVASFVSAAQITISNPADSSGTNRTVVITTVTPTPVDCNTTQAPFTSPPYLGSNLNSSNCQTGDAGTAPFQLQVFENDGIDDSVSYDTPMPGCELYVPPGVGVATYKNAWASACTFTPTQAGVYPFRVKSSSIVHDGVPIADSGSGYNNFALRVQGATATKLYAVGAYSIYANTPSSGARFYLAEITSADAGKILQIDLFDPGDGASGQYAVQVLAPPSGAPNSVPISGTTVPAAGIADSCRYNPAPSATRGPDVAAPSGADASNCTVVTRTAAGGNVYNNGWLSIEIAISPNYSCTIDCWWSVRYDFGGATGIPTDRTVWAPIIVDRPAPPAPTTSTTTSTTVLSGAGEPAGGTDHRG